VPPKEDVFNQQLRQRRRPPPPPLSKPSNNVKPLPPKPLPDLPSSNPRVGKVLATLLWILAFALWFLLIVLLFPIVMEREALIGLNTWLKEAASWVFVVRG